MRPFMIVSMFFSMAILLFFYSGLTVAGVAELPRESVRTGAVEPAPAGREHSVGRGGDLQAALNAARPGDTIILEAGAEYRGPFTLPARAGEGWITVRSNHADALPAGLRVEPGDARHMPALIARGEPVIAAGAGAHHYRFVGIEVRPAGPAESLLQAGWEEIRSRLGGKSQRGFIHNLIAIGDGEKRAEDLPHHIVFDRCYIHGDPEIGTRRGIKLNAAHAAVINSHLSGFREVGADSQAIGVWNGTGPFLIENNYLEGAGENVMFGGATPAIEGLVPADIVVRGNHFAKPLAWRKGSPGYAGTPWSVKNLFELKNARRVLVEGNLFEYNWPHAQNGFAILFTPRNEGGAAPWAVVEDVTFTRNLIRHVGNGINILGYDHNDHPSGQTRRIVISGNLFYDLGGDWGGGRWLQLLDGTADVQVTHNTVLQDDDILTSGEGRPHTGFTFTGNIVMHNEYGVVGTGTAPGGDTLETWLPGAVFRDNLIVGGPPGRYPGGNEFPRSLARVGFVDPAAGDFRLDHASRYRGSLPGGKSPGMDAGALCRALSPGEAYAAAAAMCVDSQSVRGTAGTAAH